MEEAGGVMQWPSIWVEAVAAAGPHPVVQELVRMSGLPHVAKLPATNLEVLSFRVFSTILSTRAFSSERWECRMGYTDTSGPRVGDHVRVEYFERFPELRRRLRQRREDDFLQEPAYRFWFLSKDEEAQLGFEAPTGMAETSRRETFDLMALYRRSGRRIWPVVWELATFTSRATFTARVKVAMQVKEDLTSIVRDALRELADVSTAQTPNHGGSWGVTVTTVDGQIHRLRTIWAWEGWPSDLRRALSQVPEDEWPRNLVVVARHFSPGALDLLEERDANWIDQSGQVRLVVPPGLLVYREARPIEPSGPGPTFKWSRSAIQVAEWILDQPSDRPLGTGEIAEATGWSPGRVSTVLQSFDELGWTEPKGAKSGPRAWRGIANPGAMLDSWAAHVGNQPPKKRLAHHATRDLLRFTETELRTNLGWEDDRTWALTTWAGLELVAPFVTAVPVVHIYLAADRFRSEVAQIIQGSGLREVDEGARFEFWEADFPLLIQQGQPSLTPVVATPRLYADLLALGARGADAAQHLRETRLDF